MLTQINKKIIQKSLKRYGFLQKIEAQKVIESFQRYIQSNFGKKIVEEIQPLFIKNNSLFVKIPHSLVTAQLKKQEKEIILHIKKETKTEVRRLVFRI